MKPTWWKNKLALEQKPKATIALIALSVLVYLFIHSRGDMRSWFLDYRLYVYRMNFLDCLKSALAHKNIWHLAGNVIFLWVLGFNFENRCGAWRFCVLAGAAVLIANGGQALVTPAGSHIAEIGLSGLLSFLVASYLVFFLDQPLYVLIDVSSFRREFWIPPVLMFFAFCVFQLLYGGTPLRPGETVFYAHFAGFFGGIALCWPIRNIEWIKAYIRKKMKKEKESLE